MKRSLLTLLLIPALTTVGMFSAWAQDEAPAAAPAEAPAEAPVEPVVEQAPADAPETGASEDDQTKLVTEGELAQWLVRVLGLSRFLPAAPTDLECFQVLMQNNIIPADGWQQDRTVTMGALARVVVQGMGRQSEVQNPDDESSWIVFLIELGIDFGTIGEAVENLDPLPQPVGPEAIITSTDPLGKLQRINPPDNQQLGVDFSAGGSVYNQRANPSGLPPGVSPQTPVTVATAAAVVSQATEPDRRPPMTPN